MRCMTVRIAALALVVAATGLAACGSVSSRVAGGARIEVVAAENFWGSLAAQLGGDRAHVTSVIDNPDADPHDYEPTASNARSVATANMVIVNGMGYDTWASKLVSANGSRAQTVLTVGKLVGQAADGNPHRWYSPTDVKHVMAQLTADFTKIDPQDAGYFTSQATKVRQENLKAYFSTLAAIKAAYVGTPVGASESIFAPLAGYLGLKLRTPSSFLRAVSEGTDPTAADKRTIDTQIATRAIKVYVYNTQNATPDIQAQVKAARANGIAVATVTETPTPAGASFQQWQVRQLRGLATALSTATGK